jgi:hypothetical protein
MPPMLLGQCVFDEVRDDVRVHIQQDQRVSDKPVLEILSQLRQRLQYLGGTVVSGTVSG